MDTVAHVLHGKPSEVHVASPQTSVFHVVERMCAARIGAMLVFDGGRPVGIFSERDLMTRVILAGRDPSTTIIGDVMTRDLVYVAPATPAQEAMAVMTESRCRHLPVMDGGRLVGIVSIGDLVRWFSRDQEFEIHRLTDYIAGKYPA
jgi:CBS domain-containing protein